MIYPMVELKNISKSFYVRKNSWNFLIPPAKVTALDSIDFAAGKNQVTAILGPNGAGKTTLLKVICGLLLPDTGSVNGNEKIGYLSSDAPGFYPQLTGRQNLEFFSVIYNIPRREIKKKIEEHASLLELSDLDMPFWNYSAGAKHKLALLRILAIDAETIVMDEPTKSMDPLAAKNFRLLIMKIVKNFNKTVILATHSLPEAATIGDKIVILCKGRIAAAQVNNKIDAVTTANEPLEEIYLRAITGS